MVPTFTHPLCAEPHQPLTDTLSSLSPLPALCPRSMYHHLTLITAVFVNICLPTEHQLHRNVAFSLPLRAVSLSVEHSWHIVGALFCEGICWRRSNGGIVGAAGVLSGQPSLVCEGECPGDMGGAPTASATDTKGICQGAPVLRSALHYLTMDTDTAPARGKYVLALCQATQTCTATASPVPVQPWASAGASVLQLGHWPSDLCSVGVLWMSSKWADETLRPGERPGRSKARVI